MYKHHPDPVSIMRMAKFMVPLLMTVVLSGCAALESSKLAYDAEEQRVQALFNQPYIDPLTTFLRTHEQDETRRADRERVAAEREQRCLAVAQRFAERDVTEQVLARYRAGYQYSCPLQVEAFAVRVARKPAVVTEPLPEPIQPVANPAWDTTANECYLLAGIHNHADAIRACESPARAGNRRAQSALATSLAALQQYGDARHWWLRAAQQQDRDAQIRLAELALEGVAGVRDPALAWAWYEYAGARDRAAVLAGELSLSQRRSARKQVHQQLDLAP